MTQRHQQVLIITHSQDNQSIADACALLEARGAEAIRLNTDLYPEQIALSSDYRQGRWHHELQLPDQAPVDLSLLESIWYRRMRIGKSLTGQMEPDLLRPTIEESRRTLLGVLHTLPAFCMDPFWLIRYTDNKEVQLRQAALSGLSIPKTLLSNSPAAVKRFYQECQGQMVAKMQTSFAVYIGEEEHVVFTNLMTEEDMQDIDSLTACPMIFQEAIPKKLEIRATIVGNQVFASAVNSQVSGKSDHDWRKNGLGLISDWEPYTLPEQVKARLIKLMDGLGLNYGAADFILTPAGEHIFLEVNPVGEYNWLDAHADPRHGHPITEAIVDTLLGTSHRRVLTMQLQQAALYENM